MSVADSHNPVGVTVTGDDEAAAILKEHLVKTGAWRTMRPVVEEARCNRCWWICSTFCPDGAITVNEKNLPEIDYDHCKGCLICVAQCPPHAIEAVSERIAQAREAEKLKGKPKWRQ